jgi:hypothetical protein
MVPARENPRIFSARPDPAADFSDRIFPDFPVCAHARPLDARPGRVC